MVHKIWYTYDDIHKTVKHIAQKINEAGVRYDAMIAIGGGGFIPARMLRTFLDVPIYAVTTAYYLNETEAKTGDAVQKIQWLDPVPTELAGKNVLVVDEVDDSRIHNKLKPKTAELPSGIAYFSGMDIEDWWINYPWDAVDIEAHNRRAQAGVHSEEA